MSSWIWVGSLLAGMGYVAGIHAWVYRDRILPGILAVCLLFPMFIHLTASVNAPMLRVLPLVGLVFFVHRYGLSLLLQIKLLWFSTLSLATVVTYFLVLRLAWG